MISIHRVFLDASVSIAAAASNEGASALVLEICKRGKATALVTRLVLLEVERNLQAKLDDRVLLNFYNLLAEIYPEIVPPTDIEELYEAGTVVAEKDAHVLAGARKSSATHLITLDCKHFLSEEIKLAILPIIACTPGEFLQMLLSGKEF